MKISVILPTYRKNCQEELENLWNYFNFKIYFDSVSQEFASLYWIYVNSGYGSKCNHILEPTLKSLFYQKFDDFEVILCHKYPEDVASLPEYLSGMNLKIIKEKDSIWHKLVDYATVNNIRNTGILNASGELFFFLDDMTIFNENLLQTVWNNYKDGYYTTCKTIKRIKVIDDKVVGTEKFTGMREGDGIPNSATWTYGMSVSMKECLKINGFDEIYDGSFGGTDADFGRRLSQVSRYKRKVGPTIYEFTHYTEQKKRKKIRDDEKLRSICGQSPIPHFLIANSWKPKQEQITEYEVWHKANIGELDKNWNKFMEVPFINLSEMRKCL
jgi:hypothetical protein